ncbi:formate dehydrogenase [Bacillus sp. FJAT-27225]|uniref:formate dehydrogenase accessory protein FdhE n=1 Tax=Bacillus sp. FJAT-27225 TaxID=1743144 RepID=UPI00080C2133|nr:formate dehydrogenase accessory protein FdhE [Bacillus sp. FJAT-27225]OCA82333.1 formate dehydrogenase [Bacillus sp. FJAT-27225]
MKTSVVSKEYLNLQKEIISLQEKWKASLSERAVNVKVDKTSLSEGVPLAAVAIFDFDIPLFLQWIEELKALLVKNNQSMEDKLTFSSNLIDENTARRWVDEALAFNDMYFFDFAEQHGVEKWIPHFLAETAVRPYLQLAAEKAQPGLHSGVHGAGCPVCGEPVRLAQLEGEGKKELHCPRCLAHWHDKRITCSHCGNDDHDSMKFITVEGDSVSQIQACDKCHGYIKIIDTRQYIEKPSPAMLDLNSIHLDFIAQEHGYYTGGNKGHNEQA